MSLISQDSINLFNTRVFSLEINPATSHNISREKPQNLLFCPQRHIFHPIHFEKNSQENASFLSNAQG